MRVIVTGGSGKAGTYTVRELVAAGHDVINLDVQRPPADLPAEFIQLDLTDAGEVYDAFAQTRPEGVCHLAANPSPGGFPRQQTFANNVLSTYNVMQAAGDSRVRRLIYASSEMATGWLTTEALPPRFPFAEQDSGGYSERVCAKQVSRRGHRRLDGRAVSNHGDLQPAHQQRHPT